MGTANESTGTLSTNVTRSTSGRSHSKFNPRPPFTPTDLTPTSSGGFYAPSIATQLLKQNKIGVSSVGIINGIIDLLIQTPAYPQFAVNNTYGIKAITDAQGADALDAFYRPGGGRDQTIACKALQAQYDPNNYGKNVTVNDICNQAIFYGLAFVYGPYEQYSNPPVYILSFPAPTPVC